MSVALPRLRGRSPSVVRATAVVGLLCAVAAMGPVLWIDSGRGYGVYLLVAMLVGAAALLSMRTLMPAALVLVVLSADALGVFGDHGGDNLPFIQLASIRLTLRDVALIGVLPIALLRLTERREWPVFTRPMFAVLTAIGVAFLLGVIADRDVKSPLNELRPLFGYALYPILVAAIDTRPKFNWLLGTLIGVSVVAVAIQVAEVGRGSPLPFLALPQAAGQAQAGVSVAGQQVPYIWNRATWQLFIALFLGLGCLLQWRDVPRNAGLVLVCGLGFAIMLIRSWYIFIAVGILVMLVLERNWGRRIRFFSLLGLLAAVLGTLAAAGGSLTARSYGGSLLGVLLARSQSLIGFQQDNSYVARVAELTSQWHAVLAAPILGYGLSTEGQRLVQLGNLDTGAINTLVMFGFLGTAAFVALVLSATWAAIRLLDRFDASIDRGYALGLVGIWAGVLVGYTFNYDLLTYPRGAWLVVLALAIQDRLTRLASTRAPVAGLVD